MVKKIATTEVLKEKLANARAKLDAATSEPRATRAFYDAYLGSAEKVMKSQRSIN